MKSMMKFFIILFFCSLTLSCEKTNDEADPAKIILGKWEMIEFGRWPSMEKVDTQGNYIEYLKDSVVVVPIDISKSYTLKYWIDTVLHEGTVIYKYEFSDKNQKMRLDFASGIADFPTSIWKRIQ
jgi:hypothetical protein